MGCYEDLDAGDDFVLWGNNMAEMLPVLFSRLLETKRQKPGTRIVDIATRSAPTSDYADLHVLFKPRTDLSLVNGILHLLVAEGRIHLPFITENLVFWRGIEDLKAIGCGFQRHQQFHLDHELMNQARQANGRRVRQGPRQALLRPRFWSHFPKQAATGPIQLEQSGGSQRVRHSCECPPAYALSCGCSCSLPRCLES
jgi:anaerobic selenocysteine-containing dehydrogenase